MTTEVLDKRGLEMAGKPTPSLLTKLGTARWKSTVDYCVQQGWAKRPEDPKAVPGYGPAGNKVTTESGAWSVRAAEALMVLAEPFSREDLAAALGVNTNLAGNYMSQWKRHGKVEMLEVGKWRRTAAFGSAKADELVKVDEPKPIPPRELGDGNGKTYP